ncbi:MAG: transglycosylase domain-containing protein, partial [Rhizobiaceae bacterium]
VLQARLHPADVVDRGDRKSPDFFLDWAFEEVRRLAARKGVHTMVARTTIDMNIQRAAEESLEFHLRQYGKEYGVSEGAIVVIETNGAVRAIVGGRDYGASQFNRATKALRQTGSSFKPYVYAVAMENGFTPDSVVSDGPISWGGWSPKNYARSYNGRMTLGIALAKSINTVPVRLAKEHFGTEAVKRMAESMGVESPLSSHKTMVLGTSEMTVMDQATGYSVFAEGGYSGLRHGISQLLTHGGEVVYDFDRDAPPPKRVLSEQATAYMNQMLALVPTEGTGRRSALEGIKSAGKTGTTQAYRDAWFVGFTGNFTAAVWLGNDDFTSTRNMTGGSLPAMTWQRLMTYAHQNIELKPIPGLEAPFVDPEVVARAKAAPATGAATATGMETERPPVLTAGTTRLLKDMAELFRTAPRIDGPAQPATLSSL